MQHIIKITPAILFTALLLFSLDNHAQSMDKAVTKISYPNQKKGPSFALIYSPVFGAAGEIKVFQGLSVLAGFKIVPQFLKLKYELEGTPFYISATSLYLSTRYYFTGEPLHHGFFVEYTFNAGTIDLIKTQVPVQARNVVVQNAFLLGYRFSIINPVFIELGAGASSNFVFVKNQTGYKSQRDHIFLPVVTLGLGLSF